MRLLAGSEDVFVFYFSLYAIAIVLALLIGGTILKANEMFLIEDYIEGDTTLEVFDINPLIMASISFTLDREAFVTVTTGGIIKHLFIGDGREENELYNCSWITMNGTMLEISRGSPQMTSSYVFALDPGDYEFELKINTSNSRIFYYRDDKQYSTTYNPRIQALVILSDTAINYASEKPSERGNPIQTSLTTSGPSINVPGCVEVKDVTGRTVNCEISGDRVMLSTLLRVTYFIERSDGRNVKLVKM